MKSRAVLVGAAMLMALGSALPSAATATPKSYVPSYDRGQLCGGSGLGQVVCFTSSGTQVSHTPAEAARHGILTISGGVNGFDHAAAEVVFTPEATRAYTISADVIGSIANVARVNLCLVAYADPKTGYGSSCLTRLPADATRIQFTAVLPKGIALSIELSLDSGGDILGGPGWVRVENFTIA